MPQDAPVTSMPCPQCKGLSHRSVPPATQVHTSPSIPSWCGGPETSVGMDKNAPCAPQQTAAQEKSLGMCMYGTHHVGSCLAMVPLGKLGLVAVPRLEVGGQGALNCLRCHFCRGICLGGLPQKVRVGWRLKTKFGPGRPRKTKFRSRLYSSFVRQVW